MSEPIVLTLVIKFGILSDPNMTHGRPEGISLYDRIMTHGIGISAEVSTAESRRVSDMIMDTLRGSVVFRIQNVADYFYRNSRRDIDDWRIGEDFPNIAPPYPNYFMEYRLRRDCLPMLGSEIPHAIGVLTVASDVSQVTLPVFRAALDQRWEMQSLVFTQMRRDEVVIPQIAVLSRLDSNGRPIEDEQMGGIVGRDYDRYLENRPFTDEEFASFSAFARLFYYPALLANTFLHCRGVEIIQETPDQGLSRVYQRRHQRPLVRFHVLNIRPMQEVIRREGGLESAGLSRALHIVRGHFADYREGRGLFGRHHALVWMPAHLKGSIQQGIVTKDYDVQEPRSPLES